MVYYAWTLNQIIWSKFHYQICINKYRIILTFFSYLSIKWLSLYATKWCCQVSIWYTTIEKSRSYKKLYLKCCFQFNQYRVNIKKKYKTRKITFFVEEYNGIMDLWWCRNVLDTFGIFEGKSILVKIKCELLKLWFTFTKRFLIR